LAVVVVFAVAVLLVAALALVLANAVSHSRSHLSAGHCSV